MQSHVQRRVSRHGFADSPRGSRRCFKEVGRIGYVILVVLCTLVIVGCATRGDIREVRSDLEGQLSETQKALDQLNRELENMKADITLLKSLGVAVENTQEQVKTTQIALKSLETEAGTHQSAIEDLSGQVQNFKSSQEGLKRETARLRALVAIMEKEMIEQLQTEVNLTRQRLRQLEGVIKRIEEIKKSSYTGVSSDSMRSFPHQSLSREVMAQATTSIPSG